MDIHEKLAQWLEPLGIPCCQEPMREPNTGTYVTWQVESCHWRYASGKPLGRTWGLILILWCNGDTQWTDIATNIHRLLEDIPGYRNVVWVKGSSWAEPLSKRGVVIPVTVQELAYGA